MAEKVTTMRLKVDLECSKCYKKVKKLLKKYPQIRDEKFDEKANIVTITVVCCSPEKIRDKLCCKGGGSIKSIEIVEPKPEKKPEPEKKKDAEKPKTEAATKKEAEKPKAEPEKKKEAEKPKGEPEKKKETEKPKGEPEKKKETEKPKGGGEAPKKETEKPKEKPASVPVPVHPQAPPPMAVPVGMCIPYYDGGRPAGPCYPYGGPMVCYDGYYGRPVYDSYGGGRPCYVSRCDQYLSEENANGCTVM